MPELAEVEYMRRQWDPAIGATVTGIEADYGKRIFRGLATGCLERALIGKPFTNALRHGKQLCFRFSSDVWLGIHLGMTGVLEYSPMVRPISGPSRPRPAGRKYSKVQPSTENAGDNDTDSFSKYRYLAVSTSQGVLRFHDARLFGRVQIHVGLSSPDWWDTTVPEPHDMRFTLERLEGYLQRRARAPIKALLLEQVYFPGIGNWMADEVLWRSRIHPSEKAGKLAEAGKGGVLHTKLREVCEDALRVVAPDWDTPPNDWLFNHRWADNGKCPLSGCTLVREQIGGRTTCYSPALQKRIQ